MLLFSAADFAFAFALSRTFQENTRGQLNSHRDLPDLLSTIAFLCSPDDVGLSLLKDFNFISSICFAV